MSLAVRVPRPEGARRWRTHDAERKAVVETQRTKQRAVKGLDIALRLDGGRKVEFRGRHYGVPTVPWPLALRITEAQERFNALCADPSPSYPELAAVFKEVARLFKKVCRPVGWRRLFWLFTPSPLNNASPLEVGMALGFFSEFRLRDLNSYGTGLIVHPPRSRSTPSSRASSRTTRSGATGKVGRARGSIS